jgi:serine/threonine protein kinase
VESDQDLNAEIPYKKGKFIGRKYEVYEVLGKGGFGIVYLVYSHETKDVDALKTFRDEYLRDAETRKLFRREANIWIDLERHPYLVRAYFVDEVEGRLYIGMEYIAKNEQRRNTLQDYLTHQPPDMALSLKWAIQFCYGMEYAYSRGVRCHRDVKPSNIMISTNKRVKITDFGLAGVLGSAKTASGIRLSIQQGRVGLSGSIMEGKGCGTPTHMPPEQFTDAASCDKRSDIYAFGVVLYQMAAGSIYRLPFMAALPKDDSLEEQRRFGREMYRLHSKAPVPKLNSPLFPAIQHCLEKEPDRRYQTFKELRTDLELLLKRQTGETVKPPESKELEAWELTNKAMSLLYVDRLDDNIEAFLKAIGMKPNYAPAHNNLGVAYVERGLIDEAIREYERGIEFDPNSAKVHCNLGVAYGKKGLADQAISEFKRTIKLAPNNVDVHINLGNVYLNEDLFDKAILEYKEAVELDPKYPVAHYNLGTAYYKIGLNAQAIAEYERAVELNPNYSKAIVASALPMVVRIG